MAQASVAYLYRGRARALGRASGPGVPGIRVGLASQGSSWHAGNAVALARGVRSAALRLRPHHAGDRLGPPERVRWTLLLLVDGRFLDPVLAPHRTRASSIPGDFGPQFLRRPCPDQHYSDAG